MRGLLPAQRVLVGVLMLLVGLVGVLVAGPAQAVVPPVEQRGASGVTADGLPTVQIDGVVWDQEVVGDTVYAGGQFSFARPAGAALGVNQVKRSNLLAYNIRTGELVSSFAPHLNGTVKAITASPDGTRIYVGGSFTTTNDGAVNRYRLAAFSTADGSLVTSFNAGVNAGVNAITVTSTAVYVGGAFTSVGTNARPHLAAFNPVNGALLAWAPNVPNGSVNALVATPDASRIIVGGSFSHLHPTTALGLGTLDATSGATLPWTMNQVVRNYGSTAAVMNLSTDGRHVYGTAYWFGGTGNFEGVFAADPNSGDVRWLADCHGDTYDAAAAGGVVYAVSHWHHCTNIGGFPDTNPRNQWYRSNAVSVEAKGTVDPNTQPGYHDFRGYGAPAIVSWFPTMDIGTFTGQSQASWTTEGTSEYVVQGGEFLRVNGVAQQGLVRFAIPSLAPKKQGPRLSGADQDPSLLNLGTGAVKVTWPTSWDRDDQVLTYEVQRQDVAAPLHTTTATSQFWNRPFLSFTDTTTRAGQTYSYRISAYDPDGNRVTSNHVTITPTSGVSAYYSRVQADGASSYWRMSHPGRYPDYVGNLDLAAGTGTSTRTTGAISGDPDGSAAFNGTSTGTAGAATAIAAPNTFTAEAWFTTTSTSGGKIVGFGDSQLGSSSSYDRHVYLDNGGRVLFGVRSGAVRTVQSPASYNDGRWHHVVASLSPAGMVLYVDGLRVAGDATVTGGQPYAGRWRVGGDRLTGWTNAPTSHYLAGSIDEVAIYPTALSAAQVRAHHQAASAPVNSPPTASFAATTSGLTASLDASASTDPDGTISSYAWDFGDGTTGTGATTTKTYASAGTYTVTLTVTDDRGAAGSTARAVTAAPAGMIASDAFSRTGTGWGGADVGGTWTSSGSTHSTNGSTGEVRNAAAGSGATASLTGVSARDVDVTADVAVDKLATGGGYQTTLVTRRTGSGDYRMTLQHLSTGSVRLNLTRVVSGVATSLRDVNVPAATYSPGTVLRVRLTVRGDATTALAGKVWAVGATEPATAQITASDSTPALQVAGSFAVTTYVTSSVTNAPVTFSLDNLLVSAG